MSFPSCKEDFEILKNLGKDLFQITFIAFESYPEHKPAYTTGVELSFKNGTKKLLGAKDIGTGKSTIELKERIKSIKVIEL